MVHEIAKPDSKVLLDITSPRKLARIVVTERGNEIYGQVGIMSRKYSVSEIDELAKQQSLTKEAVTFSAARLYLLHATQDILSLLAGEPDAEGVGAEQANSEKAKDKHKDNLDERAAEDARKRGGEKLIKTCKDIIDKAEEGGDKQVSAS